MKETLKLIIIENQKKIKEITVIPRDYTIEANANYIFTGPRRAGKTYFMFQIIKQTYHKNDYQDILYINFEDERLVDLTHKQLQLILDAYYEMFDFKPVLFFDEIQNIPYWEKFVRRLADDKYKIYITGSNSRMLSSELASVLGGRFLIKEILPLSFKEYIRFSGTELEQNYVYSQRHQLRRLFDQYLSFGGFPETLNYQDKREYLSSLYQKVLFGDIIARFGIKRPNALRLLVKKIAESVNNETSINRIKNILKSTGLHIGNSTLYQYLDYLNESFLITSIQNFVNSLSEKETKRKFYFYDTGLLGLFLIEQKSKLLENLVFLHLYRQNHTIYYYKRNEEVDFYLPDQSLLVQVSLNINDKDTLDRELKAFEKASKELSCKNLLLITLDDEQKLQHNGLTITVKPAWKLLLED